jgi:hypothetical protein
MRRRWARKNYEQLYGCAKEIRYAGPGVPEPKQGSVPAGDHRPKLSAGYCIVKRSVLGGLHDEGGEGGRLTTSFFFAAENWIVCGQSS